MNLSRYGNLAVMLLSEAGLFALALLLAYGLRFEFDIPEAFFRQMFFLLPAAVGFKIAFFWIAGLYRGMWRYTSLMDLWHIARSMVFAGISLVVYVTFLGHEQIYPRSVLILDPLLAFCLSCAMRIVIRVAHQVPLKDGATALLPSVLRPRMAGVRALLFGAGDDGARMAREILDTKDSGLVLVGFVDDDLSRKGRRIHDLPVFGPMTALADVAQRTGAQELLVNTADMNAAEVRHLVKLSEGAGLRLKKLPALSDIVRGKVSVKDMRDVRYEDLLRRSETQLDIRGIEGYLKDKVVLVSGAGGSIGSELCRQILRFEPHLLILYDAGEENLYAIEMELRHRHKFTRYVPVLGLVQDRGLLDSVLARHAPQVVFHAAAYKHVPMLERNPWQAVHSNIRGSMEIMEASVRHGVERFVLVSTDKAVRPTNVMGASKRVAERIMLGLQGQGTAFMAVRFGNVLGSSGSVIPLFRDQISRGGPVTVTHPEVTRYFMTIPEAAQLIIQAGAQGRGGEIFLLKMGQPVRIADLARDLIILSGKKPEDIPVVFTGLRPGEKLYEELITEGEDVLETGHDQIMVLGSEAACADCAGERLEELFSAAKRFDAAGIKSLLATLVPEYTPAPDEP